MDVTKDNFDLLHDVSPGKHFYQFYKHPEDLMKVLGPYWRAGVQSGQYCFWALPAFMTIEAGQRALQQWIPDLATYLRDETCKLVTFQEWYGDGSVFDGERVLAQYEGVIQDALRRGFQVVRLAGDGSGFKSSVWPLVRDYERNGHQIIEQLPCIALCSYPLHDLQLQQTKDVLDHHHSVLVAKV